MNVLSIQSHVVYGHVGNSAAVLPLQRQGIEVWPLPTAILAHHPGHGPAAGRLLGGGEVAALVEGLAARDLLRRCHAVLTGWLGSTDVAEAALAAVERLRAANGAAIWLCDPVIGDREAGIYVRVGLPEFFRDRALPRADVVTPNQFELEWLTGRRIASLADALGAADAARARGPKIVVLTSLRRADAEPGRIEALAVAEDGAWLGATQRLEGTPRGGGDIFAALLLGRLLKGKTVKKALGFAMAGTFGVLKASARAASDEPLLAAAQDELFRPSLDLVVQRVR